MKIEELNKLLTEAAGKLDKSTRLISELSVGKDVANEKIARALSSIFDIQHELYQMRPDLKPDYLKFEISTAPEKKDSNKDTSD